MAPFRLVVNRLLEDAQERLIFLSQTFIRDEIVNFVPSSEDLNYHKRLEGKACALCL